MRLSLSVVIFLYLVVVVTCIEKFLKLKQKYRPPRTAEEKRLARKSLENPLLKEGHMVDSKHRKTRHTINDKDKLWPNAIIPYEIDSSLKEHIVLILEAINQYQEYTCLSFIQRKKGNSTKNYYNSFLYFQNGEGCYSELGRRGGQQTVTLGEGCYYIGTIIHELGHAIGLLHEHTRPDRDSHIIYIDENVQESQKSQFKIEKESKTPRSYSFDSIMHYGGSAFSKDQISKTIVPTDSSIELLKISDKFGLSESDIKNIHELYCSSSSFAKSRSVYGDNKNTLT